MNVTFFLLKCLESLHKYTGSGVNYFPFHSSFSLVALDLERRLYSPVVRGEPGGAGDPLQANQAEVGQADLTKKGFLLPSIRGCHFQIFISPALAFPRSP